MPLDVNPVVMEAYQGVLQALGPELGKVDDARMGMVADNQYVFQALACVVSMRGSCTCSALVFRRPLETSCSPNSGFQSPGTPRDRKALHVYMCSGLFYCTR